MAPPKMNINLDIQHITLETLTTGDSVLNSITELQVRKEMRLASHKDKQ